MSKNWVQCFMRSSSGCDFCGIRGCDNCNELVFGIGIEDFKEENKLKFFSREQLEEIEEFIRSYFFGDCLVFARIKKNKVQFLLERVL